MSIQECEHLGEVHDNPWRFICAHCKQKLCTDCGTSVVHKHSVCHKCRRCDEKSGNKDTYIRSIDVDKLEYEVGELMANVIFTHCRSD